MDIGSTISVVGNRENLLLTTVFLYNGIKKRISITNPTTNQKGKSPMDNNTKVLLGIKDKNIKIINNTVSSPEGSSTLILSGILDYRPKYCPKCGIIDSTQIIRFGWRQTTVRLPRNFERDVSLKLKRRYFKCKSCNKYFLAETDLVPKNCSISYNTRLACIEKLSDTVSMKHIAKEVSTSDSFVGRTLMTSQRDFRPDLNHLPQVILMDEIKSTKSAKGAMSFEFMDADTHRLIDVLDARTQYHIEQYFKRYTSKALQSVKVIVTDMNYTYPKLVQSIFSNAIVVTDRFHIINNVVRGFNKTRIQVMKKLNISSIQYKALKKYWKLLLKPATKLDFKNFHSWPYNKKMLCETDFIDWLLSFDPQLENGYAVLQRIMASVKSSDWQEFQYAINSNQNLSETMETPLSTLRINQDYVFNAFKHKEYSNGPLEGTNNKIKLIKRTGYGFRSFFRFRLRILITFKFRYQKKPSHKVAKL